MANGNPPTFAAADVAMACAEMHKGVVSILRGLIKQNPDQVLNTMIAQARQRLIKDQNNPQAAAFLDILFPPS